MKAKGSFIVKLLWVVFSTTFIGTMFYNSASAQDPCSEMGASCRVLTASEVNAFKELVLSVKKLLPVPDPSRYEPGITDEAYTMPFVAATKIPGGAFVGESFKEGCFPMYFEYNTLSFGYKARTTQKKPAGKADNLLAAGQAIVGALVSDIELGVSLLPHPYLIQEGDESEPDAYNIEKSAEFLSWQTGDDQVHLHMIFGPRTDKEEETLSLNRPNPKFAPLKSLELSIIGPKDDVAALKKKIDRSAFAALLGPVLK